MNRVNWPVYERQRFADRLQSLWRRQDAELIDGYCDALEHLPINAVLAALQTIFTEQEVRRLPTPNLIRNTAKGATAKPGTREECPWCQDVRTFPIEVYVLPRNHYLVADLPERTFSEFRRWLILDPRIGSKLDDAERLKLAIDCGHCPGAGNMTVAEFLARHGERFEPAGPAPCATWRLIRQCAKDERPMDPVRFTSDAAVADDSLWEELYDGLKPGEEKRFERLKDIREKLRRGGLSALLGGPAQPAASPPETEATP